MPSCQFKRDTAKKDSLLLIKEKIMITQVINDNCATVSLSDKEDLIQKILEMKMNKFDGTNAFAWCECGGGCYDCALH